MEDHRDKVQETLLSGALKFSTDYVSKQQVYEVINQWVKDDSHVLLAVIRTGGDDQIAVDFRYDGSEMKGEGDLGSQMIRYFKEYFIPKLGQKAIKGWDFSSDSVVIK